MTDTATRPDRLPGQMPGSDKILIIYHANCPDGFGSAWLLRSALRSDTSVHHVELFEGKYGDEPPLDLIRSFNTTVIVDFCYPTAQLEAIKTEAPELIVLDHHQTAQQWLADSSLAVYDSVGAVPDIQPSAFAVMDQGRSGIGLTADFVDEWYGHEAPSWARNIEDRDLWRFAIPGTNEIFAAITSHPMTLGNWDLLATMSPRELHAEGVAIARYRAKLIDEIVQTAFEIELFGHKIWIAGSPYAVASDVAGVLAIRNPELFGAYFIITRDSVKWGLRSTPDGLDVAELAAEFGGGGHKHAAGFEIPGGPYVDFRQQAVTI